MTMETPGSVDDYFDAVVEPMLFGPDKPAAEKPTHSEKRASWWRRAGRFALVYLGITFPVLDYVHPEDPLTGRHRVQNITHWGTRGSSTTVLSRLSDRVRSGTTTYVKTLATPSEAQDTPPYAFEAMTFGDVMETPLNDPYEGNSIGRAALVNWWTHTRRRKFIKDPPTYHPDERELMKLGCHLTDPNEPNPNHILY